MENLVTNGLFYIVLALMVISFRRHKDNALEPLSYDTTNQLKGVAILTVLIGHLTIMLGLLKIPITSYIGAQGVEIFLFISAFGLVKSYGEKGLEGFFKKRILVIFIPYLLFNLVRIPYIIFNAVDIDSFPVLNGGDMSFITVIKSLLAVDIAFDPSMWYIQYILIWYVIFYFIFKNKQVDIKHKVWKIGIIGGLLFFLFILIGEKAMSVIPLGESVSHHLSFPLGALFALYYEKIKGLSKKTCLIISSINLIIYLAVSSAIPYMIPYYIANISFLIFILFLFMFITKAGFRSMLLCKLGGIAYHIYLNELFIIFLVTIKYQQFNYKGVLIILATSILLGIIFKIPSDIIIRKLKKTDFPHIIKGSRDESI